MPCSDHSYNAPEATHEVNCCLCEGARLAALDRRKGVKFAFKKKAKVVPDVVAEAVAEDIQTAAWYAQRYMIGRGEEHGAQA